MARESLVSTLALCACFFAIGVISLGAFTRLIDAGLGCPDWPGCYGQLIAPFSAKGQELANALYPSTSFVSYKAWAEMIHRYFAACLSLLIVGIIFTLFKKDNCFRSNVILALALIGALVYQIVLGQLTVTLKLLPIIVTQHLLGGFLILSILWLVYLNNHFELEMHLNSFHGSRRQFFAGRKEYLPWIVIGLVVLLMQIVLGAWTSTNYAALSCPDFPFCLNDQTTSYHFKEAFNVFSPAGVNYEGGVLPEAIRQTIHMTHRFGALIVTLYLFTFTLFAMKAFKRSFELMKSLYIMLGLLCLQLCIGISNIIFKLPLVTAISHTVVAVLLLLSVITFTYKLAVINPK